MKIFDSHCHLDDRDYDNDLDEVIQRAHDADVQAMMVVGLGLESGEKAVKMAERISGLHVSLGIHPHDAHTCRAALLLRLRELSRSPHVCAWGEIGLDFNRMHSPKIDQEACFTSQLALSADLGLPVIFHERDSGGRFLTILQSQWQPQRKGVVHCFSGTDGELDAYLDLGLYIGVTGIVTLSSRGCDLRRQIHCIPLDRLVVETDAPYLTPTPQRNKFRRNEPAFVRTVLLKLAEILGEDPEDLAAVIWENTHTLFGLPHSTV